MFKLLGVPSTVRGSSFQSARGRAAHKTAAWDHHHISLIILSNSLSPSLLLLLLLMGGATVGGRPLVLRICGLALFGNEKSKSLSFEFFALLLGPLLAAAGRFPLPLVPRPLCKLLLVPTEAWSGKFEETYLAKDLCTTCVFLLYL